MSYLTRHELTWNTPLPTEEQVLTRLSEIMELPQTTVQNILHHEPAKWYEHETHLSSISQDWPHTLFYLYCEGEDGDRYMTFFRNGRYMTKEYQPPVFDEKEFQNLSKLPVSDQTHAPTSQ